jgi:cell division protein FtsZ
MNEIQEFMANFDQEVDVIWGMAFDNTLEDQIKVTVLASGFNVSLENEPTSPAPTRYTPTKREPVAPAEPGLAATKRLEDEYGVQAITDLTQRQLSARYFVLTPEQMDDDDVIDMIEKQPTFGRKKDFRNQIKERQETATTIDRPVEVPKPNKRNNNGDSQTINFGDESFN